jgi:hypothetical protein
MRGRHDTAVCSFASYHLFSVTASYVNVAGFMAGCQRELPGIILIFNREIREDCFTIDPNGE